MADASITSATSRYPLFVPLKLADRIRELGPSSALWRQFVPQALEDDELYQSSGFVDPIGDQIHLQAPQIVHRYANRLLFMPTSLCPVACRYCFRKNELAFDADMFRGPLSTTLEYLKAHPEVDEVIFSGGDPLILSDQKLLMYAEAFAGLGTVKYLRLHTRTPAVMPSRVTPGLLEFLDMAQRRFSRVALAIHCNHLEEIDQDVSLAFSRLRATGVELLAQTVLLKNINNRVSALAELFRRLSELGARPYYLHHPDQVRGAQHFGLDLEEGQALYRELRRVLPGWMLPHYVVDDPRGTGKASVGERF
jgi:lysine 2,3-aminomutase